MYFQLEAEMSPVPEPSTYAGLLGIPACHCSPSAGDVSGARLRETICQRTSNRRRYASAVFSCCMTQTIGAFYNHVLVIVMASLAHNSTACSVRCPVRPVYSDTILDGTQDDLFDLLARRR